MFSCFIRFTAFVNVIFCKNCKNHSPLFQRNDLVAIFIDLKHLQPSQPNYIFYMIVGRTNTNLVKFLEQRFTSNRRMQLQGNISYKWSFLLSSLIYGHLFNCVFMFLGPFFAIVNNQSGNC